MARTAQVTGVICRRRASGKSKIAVVSLESTLGDVIAVRAEPVADGIRYAVVDEYGSTFGVICPVKVQAS